MSKYIFNIFVAGGSLKPRHVNSSHFWFSQLKKEKLQFMFICFDKCHVNVHLGCSLSVGLIYSSLG